MHRRTALPALVAAVAVLAGCAASSGSPAASDLGSDRPLPSVSAPESVASDEGEPVTGEVPADILDAVVADAARQIGIGEDEIEVVRAESITWNDGSLGCPEPGMMYTQALVDGYRVVVDADGQELDYRVDSSGGFRICDSPIEGGG